MSVADFAVKVKLVLIEDDDLVGLALVGGLERLSVHPVKLRRRVRWITPSNKGCLYHHSNESQSVDNRECNRDASLNRLCSMHEQANGVDNEAD